MWQLLLSKSEAKADSLLAAQQLLAFRREADEVEAWISGKVTNSTGPGGALPSPNPHLYRTPSAGLVPAFSISAGPRLLAFARCSPRRIPFLAPVCPSR
jgi:hypothetical protein